jgi:hypothetical protein
MILQIGSIILLFLIVNFTLDGHPWCKIKHKKKAPQRVRGTRLQKRLQRLHYFLKSGTLGGTLGGTAHSI